MILSKFLFCDIILHECQALASSNKLRKENNAKNSKNFRNNEMMYFGIVVAKSDKHFNINFETKMGANNMKRHKGSEDVRVKNQSIFSHILLKFRQFDISPSK